MLGPPRVLVIGSSQLPPQHMELAVELGRRLMTDTGCVLVTGGLKSKGPAAPPALDDIVVKAALESLPHEEVAPRSRIETLIPEKDVDGFQRVQVGTVIRVPYTNLRMRRLFMVLRSDAAIAIGGSDATGEMIDLAFMAEKPVIPLPTTGGIAKDKWEVYKKDILERLKLSVTDVDALENPKSGSHIVSTCLEIVRRALRPQCFLAMRILEHPLPNVFEIISDVADQNGYKTIRVDQEKFTGDIIDEIWKSIRQSDIVIADLTAGSPNVYYELGISHALNKPTLLFVYSRNGQVPSTIPFDISTRRILPYGTDQSLRSHLRQELSALLQR